MARILFFPAMLIILALAVSLILYLIKMFRLSKSKDVTLSNPHSYEGDIRTLTDSVNESLNNLGSVQYQSIIYINYRKITSFYKNDGKGNGYCKIIGKSAFTEITRENQTLLFKTKKTDGGKIPRDNPWLDFWCNVSTLEESIHLFSQDNVKVITRDMGSYQQRKYFEIIAVSPIFSSQANKAFESCTPFLSLVYGKNLLDPGINIRNFMMRVLVNNLTYLPDFIEVKFNIFRGDDFICDYLQNSRLRY